MDNTVLIAIVSSSAFATLLSFCTQLIRDRMKNKHGVAAGVKIILYDRIKWMGNKYLDRGYITSEELEDLVEMHRIYHDELIGNGFLDEIMKKVKALPLKKGA